MDVVEVDQILIEPKVPETGYQKISNIVGSLDDKEAEIIIFDRTKLSDFVTKISGCKTVRKMIDSVDIDELNSVLTLIDVNHNSAILKDRIDSILGCVNSNYSMDYFAEMLATIQSEEDSNETVE